MSEPDDPYVVLIRDGAWLTFWHTLFGVLPKLMAYTVQPCFFISVELLTNVFHMRKAHTGESPTRAKAPRNHTCITKITTNLPR
jgi:hypothetical protein